MGSTSPLSCARRTKNEPCPVLENDVKKGRWPCEVSAGSDLFQTVKPDSRRPSKTEFDNYSIKRDAGVVELVDTGDLKFHLYVLPCPI
jgi:hypothetical protein